MDLKSFGCFFFFFFFSKEEGEGKSYGKLHKDNNFQGQES